MKTTVICIGDSITEGIGSSAPSVFSYAAQLQTLLGKSFFVENCGRNGAMLMHPANNSNDQYRMQPQYERAVLAAKQAKKDGKKLIVSIMLGSNDADVASYGCTERDEAYYNKYHDKFLEEMFLLIDTFAKIDSSVSFVIAKSPMSYDKIKHENGGNLESVWRFQQEVANICKERGFNTALCDMSAATMPQTIGGEKGVEAFYRDKLHPNDVGHMYFAHFFYEAVVSLTKK